MQAIKRKPLLSTNNAKTIKGEGKGYITYILYMSSFTANSKGINLCSHASQGCADSCLVGSGNGGMFTSVMQGRVNKSDYFLSSRLEFLNQLKTEITKAIAKHKDNAIVTIRLNGTTDIRWEKFNVFEGKNIFEIFPDVQFYDYTKNHLRFDTVLPSNYHLTFSRSETNHAKAIELLKRGINVAMVFDKLPDTYEGYEVINADNDDLRFLDKKGGVICGLKYKNMTGAGADNAKAFTSGFAIRTQPIKVKKAPAKKVGAKAKKVEEVLEMSY
jgi:hypothetical protein